MKIMQNQYLTLLIMAVVMSPYFLYVDPWLKRRISNRFLRAVANLAIWSVLWLSVYWLLLLIGFSPTIFND